MNRWTPCGGAVTAGDVVRWTEPVWAEKGKRKKKVAKVGSRAVTASVLRVEGREWVHLSALECTITDIQQVKPLQPLRRGEALKRKRVTLERGRAERLQWSDESARAVVVSRFLRGS